MAPRAGKAAYKVFWQQPHEREEDDGGNKESCHDETPHGPVL